MTSLNRGSTVHRMQKTLFYSASYNHELHLKMHIQALHGALLHWAIQIMFSFLVQCFLHASNIVFVLGLQHYWTYCWLWRWFLYLPLSSVDTVPFKASQTAFNFNQRTTRTSELRCSVEAWTLKIIVIREVSQTLQILWVHINMGPRAKWKGKVTQEKEYCLQCWCVGVHILVCAKMVCWSYCLSTRGTIITPGERKQGGLGEYAWSVVHIEHVCCIFFIDALNIE